MILYIDTQRFCERSGLALPSEPGALSWPVHGITLQSNGQKLWIVTHGSPSRVIVPEPLADLVESACLSAYLDNPQHWVVGTATIPTKDGQVEAVLDYFDAKSVLFTAQGPLGGVTSVWESREHFFGRDAQKPGSGSLVNRTTSLLAMTPAAMGLYL